MCYNKKELKAKEANMLKLEKITKDYVSGDSTVKALKGIDIEFRKSEFVSILGQSRLWKNNSIKYHRRIG